MTEDFTVKLLLQVSRGIRFLLVRLPTHWVLFCTGGIGAIAGKICSKDERISVAQLRLAFPRGLPRETLARLDSKPVHQSQDSVVQYRTLARRAFRHVGLGVGEMLLWKRYLQARVDKESAPVRSTRRPESITGDGEEIIEKLIRSKSGAVGLSAHLGSFELLAAYLVQRGLKCSVIGRAPNYPLLEKVIREFRQAYGVSVIWSDDPQAPRQMINAVRDGRVLCTLIDQDTKWKSEFAPFFGLAAASPIAPIQLALRYKLPMFSSFIVRTAPMSHHVTTQTIPYDPSEPQVISAIIRTYNERLEALIRQYPEQYIWWHRRWRRRPDVDYGDSTQLLRGSTEYTDWLGLQLPSESS